MNQEFTLGEVQEPPSVGLRTAPCMALTTYRVVSFCRIGVKSARLQAVGVTAWRRSETLRGVLVAAVVCLLALSDPGFAFFHKKNDSQTSSGNHFQKLGIEKPKEAIQAPDFTLEDPSGARVRLKELRGKVVFLNFWATWCPPCVKEMPTMEKLHRELGDKGLMILAINYRETAEEIQGFFKQHKLTFTALLDRDGKVFELYNAWGLPMSVIVNKRGELVGRVAGYRDWHSKDAQEFFHQLLAEKP